MTKQYRSPRQLAKSDDVEGFACNSEEQTNWLHKHARQAHATGTATVLVVTEVDSDAVVAYYAWSMASISADDAPGRFLKSAGKYPQPVALLARLGVDRNHEGHGLGAALLTDVITRSAEISQEIGCRGPLIHAETPEARKFYLHLIPEFESSPTDELHLVLLMKDLRKTLAKGG